VNTSVHKDAARRLFTEVISQHRMELLDELVAEDAVDETTGVAGREGFREHVSGVWHSVGDVKATVTDVIAAGDRVAVWWQIVRSPPRPAVRRPALRSLLHRPEHQPDLVRCRPDRSV